MSDVSAIILSLGEPFVPRAVEAVGAQTLRLRDVVMVEHVSPWHRALMDGVARVTTPFFVQVDADMIPDPGCVAELRAAMEDDVGVTCGNLRDPLMGQVEGIKLYRTDVVRSIAHRDSVASETDFVSAMQRAGWRLKYIGRSAADATESHRTFGAHQPDYTADYTLQKYLMEGRKYRYRGARSGLFSKFAGLHASAHEMAPFARIALAHGFFLDDEQSLHGPPREDPRARALVQLLATPGKSPAVVAGLFPLAKHGALRTVFRASYSSGRALATSASGQGIRETMDQLAREPRGWPAIVASLGFGHGILSETLSETALTRDERKLRSFLSLGIGRRMPAAARARATLEWLYYRVPQALVPRRVVPFWRRVPRW